MNEETNFIREIQEHPQDEVTRLVYADWLEDAGNLSAAEYLRAEAKLAKVSIKSSEAPQLRNLFWQTWAAVDPGWRMIFTQPRMLRANPTPFPSAWKSFGLGELREEEGTYATWSYDSVPDLPIDEFRGEFQYLQAERTAGQEVGEGNSASMRRMLVDAAEKGVLLPAGFVTFMNDRALRTTFHSVTDCFFTLPDEYSPIRADLSGEGMLVHFYCDSQTCLLWDMYIHASGAHCVIARWPDYFDPYPPDPDDEQSPYAGPLAWFVAPSFEAFVYRVWIENQIWYIENADVMRRRGEMPPPITPEIQAYIDHYRSRKDRG